MERKTVLLLSAILTVLFSAFTATAESHSGDPVIDRAMEAFKEKHPDIYEMIDVEKFTAYAVSSHQKALAAKKQISSGKNITKEDAAAFRVEPPPPDLIKPEALETLKSKIGVPGGIDPSQFDPKNFDTSQAKRWRELGAKLKNTPKTILGHVQAGAVESLPSASEIKETKTTEKREVSSLPLKRKPLQFAMKVPDTMPDLPACPKDTSMKYQFGTPGEKEATLKDILFIRAPIPSVPDELFGKKVRVFQYTRKSGDPASVAIKAMRVPCLPFRMRLSEHLSVQDFGMSALRNYDRDFNGKGDVHPYVKQNQAELLR